MTILTHRNVTIDPSYTWPMTHRIRDPWPMAHWSIVYVTHDPMIHWPIVYVTHDPMIHWPIVYVTQPNDPFPLITDSCRSLFPTTETTTTIWSSSLSLSSLLSALSPPGLLISTNLHHLPRNYLACLVRATSGLAPPQRAESDDLAARVPELSLSYGQETVGIKRDIEQIKLDMATMASGIESLRKNDRDKEKQQADILRLQSMVTQLRDENAQLLEEQRYSGTAGQLARFTLSLPSVISPIRSSSPIVCVSLTNPTTSSRGLVGKLGSKEILKKYRLKIMKKTTHHNQSGSLHWLVDLKLPPRVHLGQGDKDPSKPSRLTPTIGEDDLIGVITDGRDRVNRASCPAVPLYLCSSNSCAFSSRSWVTIDWSLRISACCSSLSRSFFLRDSIPDAIVAMSNFICSILRFIPTVSWPYESDNSDICAARSSNSARWGGARPGVASYHAREDNSWVGGRDWWR